MARNSLSGVHRIAIKLWLAFVAKIPVGYQDEPDSILAPKCRPAVPRHCPAP